MSGGKAKSGRPIASANRCEDFTDKTTLNSPKATVISKLKEGDVLRVDLQPIRAGGATVVAITPGDQVAGAITSTKSPQLIKCIEKGHKYQALVVEIDGGRCTVEISVAS
jgi:hypothetical protein